MGLTFQQRPQLTHQCINFQTRNSRQDLQQAVDALLLKGAIKRVIKVTSFGCYCQLFLVPKKTGDLRSVIDLSTLNCHMVVPHFKMEAQGSVRAAIRSRVDSVHRYPRRIFTCPDAPGRPKVSALCGQQESLPIHLSTLGIGNITLGVHQTLVTSHSAVKAARCEAAHLLRRLADPCRYS